MGVIFVPKAYFVRYPDQIYDLKVPHLINLEEEYEIVKIVELDHIDYENFITDFLADRQFIEDNYHLCFPCSANEPKKCLFVKWKKRPDGVLVVPYDGCFVKEAAYIMGI